MLVLGRVLCVFAVAVWALLLGPLCFGAAAPDAAANPTLDIAKAFHRPSASALIGPIVIECVERERRCVAFPDTFESAAATGRSIKFGDLSTAQPGDFIFGHADAVGLNIDDALWQRVQTYLAAGQAEYEKNLVTPPTATDLSGPPQLANLPSDVRSAIIAYPKTAAARPCTVAIKGLKLARMDPGLQVVSPENEAILGTLQAIYRASCLSSNSPRGLSATMGRLVYFVDGDAVTCAGVVVHDNVVLTAKHCFAPDEDTWLTAYQENGGILPDYSVGVYDIDGRKAVVVGDMRRSYSVTVEHIAANGNLDEFDPIRDADRDFLYVRLIGYRGKLPALKLGSGLPGEQLRIPGLFMTGHELVAQTTRAPSSARAAVLGKLQYDSSPLCALMVRHGNCIYHICQTDHGYSGTPIFGQSGKSLELIGVHTGNFNQALPAACGFSRAKYFQNYGVIPAEEQPR